MVLNRRADRAKFVGQICAAGLLGFLLAMVVLHIRNPIGFPLTTGLIGATALISLLPPVLVVLALALGHKRLGAIGLVLTLVFGYWASADIRLGPGRGEKPDEAIRVATTNIYLGNPDPAESLREILAADPDIILLQEVSPSIWATIEAMPELDSYTNRTVNPRDNPDGTAILSRLPVEAIDSETHGTVPITWADIHVGDESVRIINLHISAPLSTYLIERGDRQMREIRDLLDASDETFIIAGDFNATAQHERFDRLMSDDLGDAHQQGGRGFGATWGSGRLGPVPAFLRIDHVLTDKPLESIHSWTASLCGSDHSVLYADIIAVASS